MLVHNVFFWLKEGLDDEAVMAFEAGLESLTNEPTVESGYFGTPADIHRAVIDDSYTYGLVLVFADKETHDRYQVGPIHTSFLDHNAYKRERVLVLDIQT